MLATVSKVKTPGKRSPDGKLREYAYCREIVKGIADKLTAEGYKVHILVPEDDDISLSVRVKRANKLYAENNKKALLVSVHLNAAGNGSSWLNARGWSVFVAQNASSNSKRLADNLKKAADNEGLKVRIQKPGVSYWVQSLAICRDTNCPAVLTENLFQDNKEDVAFLMSDAGKQAIINLHVNGVKSYIG